MADDFIYIAFPPRCTTPLRVRCRPVGKRRYSAWVDGEFLGHAIARVDGTWSSKAPDEVTYPGCCDLSAALLGLLELRAGVRARVARLESASYRA